MLRSTIRIMYMTTILLTSLSSHAQRLDINQLTDSSYVFTTYQIISDESIPFSSNGFIQVTTAGILLIDTPWDTTQFQPLLDSIELRFHQPVKWVIATHSHNDRTAGLDYYRAKGIATYSSFATQKICSERGEPQAQYTFLHDTTFILGSTEVNTFFPGAGHAPDNIVIWFPENRILYGGCFVKSTEAKDIGNKADANFGTWRKSIRLVEKTFKHPKWIIPGHQSWGSKKSLKYTKKLIRKI